VFDPALLVGVDGVPLLLLLLLFPEGEVGIQ